MALLINLRHLEHKSLHINGLLPLEELDIVDIRDELIHLSQPLAYDLEAERMENAILVQGKLRLMLDCECGRCLKPYPHPVELLDWAVHLPLEGEDKVSVINDCVDLTPFVRDDILLAFPQQPLCEPECKGLPGPVKGQGKAGEHDLNLGSSAWAELNKLKFK